MPDRPSIARDLFDSIIAHDGHPDSASFLRSMVNSSPPTMESEYLDFKVGRDHNGQPISDRDAKQTWCEALAGFATTSGGVLIWGIDARRTPGSTVDATVAVSYVADPHGLKSRLQQLQHQATDPPVPGVLIEAFVDAGSAGGVGGFVVCYVPESDYKPHRAETAGSKRWVMRIGDSFVDVPPPVLRSLFYPQRNSYVIASAIRTPKLLYRDGPLKTVAAEFSIDAICEGPASADKPVFIVKLSRGWTAKRLTPRGTSEGSRRGYIIQLTQAFHPGQRIELCEVTVPLEAIAYNINGVPDPIFADVRFDIDFLASDQLPQRINIEIEADAVRFPVERFGFPSPLPPSRFR
jgi:hypothetical protein